MTRRQWIVWSIIASVLTLATLWAFWPRSVPVDIAEVTRGPMMETLSEDGEARIHDIYVVSAPASGHLTRIDVEPGDCVVPGETMIATVYAAAAPELDARSVAEAEAGLRAARAALAAADADIERHIAGLEMAEADLERTRTLARSGTASPQALDRWEADVRTQQAALRAAEAGRERARFDVQRWQATLMPGHLSETEGGLTVSTPVPGTVLQVLRDSEGPVVAGEPLIELGHPEEMEIVADFLSEDAVKAEAGHKVIIRDWGGEPVMGQVRRVEPYAFTKVSALGIEEQRTNLMIDLDHVPDGLGHGYRVRVDVVIWEGDNVVRLPLTALFKSGETWVAYKEVRGRAVLTPIEVGHMNGDYAEVVSGLSDGDRVVEHPSNRISDGVRIKARPVASLGIETDQSVLEPGILSSRLDRDGPCARY